MTLDCYKEVPAVLKALQNLGAKTAILSNGSPHMLNSAVKSAGLDVLLDNVFSVDEISTFKTMPITYQLITDAWNVDPEEIQFQSSNRWDIAGAKSFGFRCNWINRTKQPDEYIDLAPDRILHDLADLIQS